MLGVECCVLCVVHGVCVVRCVLYMVCCEMRVVCCVLCVVCCVQCVVCCVLCVVCCLLYVVCCVLCCAARSVDIITAAGLAAKSCREP
jgi:hypothetical protein